MTENSQMLDVQLRADWVGEIYLDLKMPMLETGMIITLPFHKKETPDDDTRIFTVQEIHYYANLSPPLLVAHLEHEDPNEQLTLQDFLDSGWKRIVY